MWIALIIGLTSLLLVVVIRHRRRPVPAPELKMVKVPWAGGAVQRGSLRIENGVRVSGMHSDGNRVIIEQIAVREGRGLFDGIQVVDDDQGTRVVVPPGMLFTGIVNGCQVNVNDESDEERVVWIRERTASYRT